MRSGLIFALVLAWSACAWAQVPSAPTLKADAQAVIDAASAQAFFVALDHPTMRRVKHTPSGMVCSFQPNSRAQLQVFPGQGTTGDDVACVENQGTSEMAMFATRLPEATAHDFFESSERSLMGWEWRLPPSPLNSVHKRDKSPDDASVVITYDRQHRLYLGFLDESSMTLVRLAVAKAGDWCIKQRFRANVGLPQGDSIGRTAPMFDVIGERVFASILGQIAQPSLIDQINARAFADPAAAARPVQP